MKHENDDSDPRDHVSLERPRHAGPALILAPHDLVLNGEEIDKLTGRDFTVGERWFSRRGEWRALKRYRTERTEKLFGTELDRLRTKSQAAVLKWRVDAEAFVQAYAAQVRRDVGLRVQAVDANFVVKLNAGLKQFFMDMGPMLDSIDEIHPSFQSRMLELLVSSVDRHVALAKQLMDEAYQQLTSIRAAFPITTKLD